MSSTANDDHILGRGDGLLFQQEAADIPVSPVPLVAVTVGVTTGIHVGLAAGIAAGLGCAVAMHQILD
ncbi:MAG TPA: hypothetical protein VI365_07925 [Trebonia sp.]